MDRIDRIRRDLDLLRHRLASGEIDESTYDRLKAKLLKDVAPEDLEELRLTPTPAGPKKLGPVGGTRTRPTRLADLDFTPGMVLVEQFQIVRELGRGGFGAVFEAMDIHLGKRLAVKVLDPRMASQESLLTRFRREVAVMRDLAHPRIVRVFDYREDPERHLALISMELVDGGSVRDLLNASRTTERRIPAALSLTILSQTLEALAVAHDRGVIHRDVTPGNILLSGGSAEELLRDLGRDPGVKLVDFGIAGLVERTEISSAHQAVGTTGYAAPELSDPDAPVTPAVDSYGAGAMCYHLLTGTKPAGNFEAPSELREGLSKDVDALVLALLERSPERRPGPEEAALEAARLAALASEADRNWLEAKELTQELDNTCKTLRLVMESGEQADVHKGISDARDQLGRAKVFLDQASFPPPPEIVRAQGSLEELTSLAMAWTSSNDAAGGHEDRSRELAETLKRAMEEENLDRLREAVAAAREHLLIRLPESFPGKIPRPPNLANAEAAREALQQLVDSSLPVIAVLEDRAAKNRERAEELTRLVEGISNARSMLLRAEQLGDARSAGDWMAYAQELLSQGRDLMALLPPATAGGLEDAMVELARQLGQTRSWLAMLAAQRNERMAPPGDETLTHGEPETPKPSGTAPPSSDSPARFPSGPVWPVLLVALAVSAFLAWTTHRDRAHQSTPSLSRALRTPTTRASRRAVGAQPMATPIPKAPSPTLRRPTPTLPLPPPTPVPATLVVRSDGARDTVSVDGEPVSSTPARLRLPAGRHEIRLTRVGCRDAIRQVDLAEGTFQELRLQPTCPTPTVESTGTTRPSGNFISRSHHTHQCPAHGEPGEISIQTPLEISFRRIPSGVFFMGSSPDEHGRFADEVRHRVVITHGFWMMEREVTQKEWTALMASNPSAFQSCGGNCPVENVSWYDALRFTNALSKRAGLPPCYEIDGPAVRFAGVGCRGYRLPTESEWEYAARAGSMYLYAGGNDPAAVAWYQDNSQGRTHQVGTLRSNRWGLFDMSGNVWEWCWDGYRKRYPDDTVRDPLGPPSATAERVLRGGAWRFGARDCRVAARFRLVPGYKSYIAGFRVVRSIR